LELKTFNLKQIQDLFDPVNNLEGKLNRLSTEYKQFNEISEELAKKTDEENLINQLKKLNSQIKAINNKLSNINNQNLEKFLNFQDTLIKKYKQIHINRLKQLGITPNHIKKTGLSLIEEKNTARIIKKSSYIPSIQLDEWIDLMDYLKNSSLFISIIDNVNNFYEKLIQDKLKKEISKIPDEFEPSVIKNFKKHFREDPQLTFDKFIRNIEQQRIKKEIEEKSESIQEAKEKEELEELKREQEEQKKLYEDYLKYSDKEFERRRRKQKRENLTEIAKKPKKKETISEDVEEKIKKFKSKFENSFEDRYLIQKDDSIDPKNVVRDRKKRKKEEYKEFLKKFKDKSNNK